MGIAARIFLFTPSCVQRFLISWGKFGNRCRVTDAAMRIVSPAAVMAAAMSASDSILRCRKGKWHACSGRRRNGLPRPILIFRCRKGEWPACYGRRRNDLPHPILFFVAAKENSFACSSRSSGDLPRPILIFVAVKENGSPAAAVAATRFRIRFYSSLPQRRTARLQ